MDPLVVLAALVLTAFVPPVAYVVWIRNTERREREPWGQLVKMFAWGAIGGVILGIVFSIVLSRSIFLGPLSIIEGTALAAAILAAVIAPIAEEPAKALGLRWVKDPYPEPEDGFVYGAAAGLGFAAMETLFYVGDAYLTSDVVGAAATGFLRAFSSAFLHGTTTAIVGYGYLQTRSLGRTFPYLVTAIVVHAAYNGILSVATVVGGPDLNVLVLSLIGLVLAIAIAVTGWRIVRTRVRTLDAERA